MRRRSPSLQDRSDLFNQNSTCGHPFNGCQVGGAGWGFQWTDTRVTAPAQVEVDFYQGLNWGQDTKTVRLNGVVLGTFLESNQGMFTCSPPGERHVLTFAVGGEYNVGGFNGVTFNSNSCEGARAVASTYATITVD